MRALVVDDSRAMRTIVGRLMRELGFEVVEAGNGHQALAVLEAHPDVAIALLDWNMPEMNGIELVQAIRADARWAALKLVMITTESEASQSARAMAAGAQQYVTKPFTKDQVLAKLALLGLAPSEAA